MMQIDDDDDDDDAFDLKDEQSLSNGGSGDQTDVKTGNGSHSEHRAGSIG